MTSYLLYIYVCNKYPLICIHVAHSLESSLKYVHNLLLKDQDYQSGEIMSLEYEGEDISIRHITDKNFVDLCQESLDNSKYCIFNLPIDFYDNIIDENIYEELKDCCKHNFICFALVQTDPDGTFRKQYLDAYTELL